MEHEILMDVHAYARGGGIFYLSGTTAVAGAPDTAVSRPVQLLTGIVYPTTLRKTYSDESGVFRFDNITGGAGVTYAVVSHDPTGVYDPVVKAGITPEMLPPDPLEHP